MLDLFAKYLLESRISLNFKVGERTMDDCYSIFFFLILKTENFVFLIFIFPSLMIYYLLKKKKLMTHTIG